MKKRNILTILVSLIFLSFMGVKIFDYGKRNLSGINENPILFGATYMTLNNPFFKVIDQEMRNVIEANGDVMITMDPELSLEKQIDQIHYLMNEGCQVIFVNPVDSKGLIDVLNEAKNKGIFIVAVDTNIYNGQDYVDATVVSDNYQAGVECALDMMKNKEKANILLLTHEATTSGRDRIQGFLDTIKDHKNYHLVDRLECEGQLEKSMPLIKEMIQQGIEFDVLMSLNDPAALGAVAALQDAHKLQDVMVYSIDGTPEVKILVNEGFVSGTVAQYPKKMGKIAVELSYKLLHHEKINDEEIVEIQLINHLNIQDFSLEGWQ